MLTFEQVDQFVPQFFPINKSQKFKIGYLVYLNENMSYQILELQYCDDRNGNAYLYAQFPEKAFLISWHIYGDFYVDRKFSEINSQECYYTPIEYIYWLRTTLPTIHDKFNANYYRNAGSLFFLSGIVTP